MTGVRWIRQGWRIWHRDESGASLVMALVFVTVVSVLVAATLTFVDASMRSTTQLRNLSAETAAADGAANIAINTLREGTYNGSSDSCFGAESTLSLSDFYERRDGTRDSVRVTCEFDPGLATAPIGTPDRALLTVDTSGTSLNLTSGVVVMPLPAPYVPSLRVGGSVHSNSTIFVANLSRFIPLSNLTATGGTIRARRACSLGTGLFNPSAGCNTGTTVTETHPVPSTSGLPTRAVPTCQEVMEFQPGRYTDYGSLSNRTSVGCEGGDGILTFTPGVYFFDFSIPGVPDPLAIIPWSISAGNVIGGRIRPGVALVGGTQPAMPESCVSPVPTGPGWLAPAPDDGVTFVFSGKSQMLVSGSARVELCGRYAGATAPVVIAGQPTTGALGGLCASSGWPCAAVSTLVPDALYVQGTTYLPTREVVLTLNNESEQSFRGGVIARRFGAVTSRRSSSPPVIEVPTDPHTQRRTVVLLNVYVCPGQSSCAGGGTLRLRSKVGYTDPTGVTVAGARQVTVLSWSVQH